MSLDQVWTVVSTGSPVVLAAGLWAVITGRLVPRYVYDEMAKQRDQWREIANNSLHLFGARDAFRDSHQDHRDV